MKKIIIQLLIIWLPWKLRRFFLNKIFHYKIHKSAKIGLSIILACELVMDECSRIGSMTFCKEIDSLKMGQFSSIGNFNKITGYSARKYNYQNDLNRKCEFSIGEHSALTMNHIIDCNGSVYIGKFTTIAGYRSQILTHSINIYSNKQSVASVNIGDYCFLGTGSIILPGSSLPDYSILGAGSVLNKDFKEPYSLYAGVPARKVKTLLLNEISYFSRKEGVVL